MIKDCARRFVLKLYRHEARAASLRQQSFLFVAVVLHCFMYVRVLCQINNNCLNFEDILIFFHTTHQNTYASLKKFHM